MDNSGFYSYEEVKSCLDNRSKKYYSEKPAVFVKPLKYQQEFLDCKNRYPCIISGVGSGKTMFMLLKIINFCRNNPGARALVVRKEYTNLKDSTLVDFNRYFPDLGIDNNQDCYLPNGSLVMFRHGNFARPGVLKNITLDAFGIEQGEEYENNQVFVRLTQRLRGKAKPLKSEDPEGRQRYQHFGIVIANANGHNWVWRMWKHKPASDKYKLFEATTFDNKDNLPADFIDDMRELEKVSPHEFRRMCLNSYEEDNQDALIPYEFIQKGIRRTFNSPMGTHILGVDVGGRGDDHTALTVFEDHGYGWRQVYLDYYQKKDPMYTVGRIADLMTQYNLSEVVVDDTSLGGGIVSRLRQVISIPVIGYIFTRKKLNTGRYADQLTKDYFKIRELIELGKLDLIDDSKQNEDLGNIRLEYISSVKPQVRVMSKQKVRNLGKQSYDCADAVMMAATRFDRIKMKRAVNYYQNEQSQTKRMRGFRKVNHSHTVL